MKMFEAQRGAATHPRSHSEAQDAPRPFASQPRALRALCRCPELSNIQGADTPSPNPHTCLPDRLPLGPQWPLPQTRLLGRAGIGQARSGRVLSSPRSEDALRQVPDRRDAPSTAKSNLPTPLCTSLYHRRSRGAAGRSGGGGASCGKQGGARAGATPRTATQAASTLRPAGVSAGEGGVGSWTAHRNASWEMEFALGEPSHKEPRENYKSGSAPRGSRAATPLSWAPALRPPR